MSNSLLVCWPVEPLPQMYGLFLCWNFPPWLSVLCLVTLPHQCREGFFGFFFPCIEFKKQALNDPKDMHTAFRHSGAYKQIAQSYCHACAFDAADPMYSSAIKSKCLEGVKILRTNLALIQALTALSCARWAKQLHLSLPKTPQVLRNNSNGTGITMGKCSHALWRWQQ